MTTTTDQQDNLSAWPSDKYYNQTTLKKFNVVEFYHQILWASQQYEVEEETNKNKRKVVTFSTDPPIIHEYEPGYSKNCLFDYSFFKRKFHQHYHSDEEEEDRLLKQRPQQKQYVYHPPVAASDEEAEEQYDQHSHRLMKTRSLSEFRPIRNQQINNNQEKRSLPCFSTNSLVSVQQQQSPFLSAQIDVLPATTTENNSLSAATTPHFSLQQQEQQQISISTEEEGKNDPPPSYIEYNISLGDTNNEIFLLFDKFFNRNNAASLDKKYGSGNSNVVSSECMEDEEEKENTAHHAVIGGTGGKAFFRRTLRKIKSSPKLMRRYSMVSLRITNSEK